LSIAAQKLGIPEVAHLTDLTPPEPPAKLADVLALYEAKRKKISKDEASKVRAAWDLFASTTQARTLADIDQDAIESWEDAVFDELESGDEKPKTVRHRIQRVTRVLRYAARKRLDPRNAERVLALINAIDLPTAGPVDPMPISVEDFHKLYRAADQTWKTILLISLNACFYPQDVRTLPVDAVDLAQACLRFRREKTGVARVAMLWPETQKAIREYLACRGHDSGMLILSVRGVGFTYAGFHDAFDRLRQTAGTAVNFNQIRDGAFTAACTTGVDSRDADILAGHRCGMADAYVLRNPGRTKAAVNAIREHYQIADLVKPQKAKRRATARGRTPRGR
jgi:integrase